MNKKLGLSMRGRHILEGYSFISLWIAGFFLFMAYPLGRSLYFSFNNMETSKNGLQASYVGMLNYRSAFSTDIDFLPLLKSTMSTMLTQVPLILIFAMFSALLLNGKIKGRTIFRGIFFLPVIIASGAVLKELMQQGAAQLPIFTQGDLMDKLGGIIPENVLEPLLEYADSLTLVMWDSGVQILIFIAGLQTISPQLYEAAKMDGATKWESFWKITFPMIIPMLFVNTLYSIVNMFTKADNKVMDYIVTQQVFQKNNYGYASALGWIYFILIAIVLAIVFIIFRRSLAATEGRG
ncbi:lactose ABC transporter permease [Paenibacillus sp. CCS19]|uniref:carbohydrate ABC transporter permease n=1 Tax=Paenibacillus sp. CCS19 TaxID=3158387 RepID=UPI002565509B|nr:sugar ABC transporter permease [Paenibacillus cellulosilyticus]GMK42627.1 lactose ABC transporter permease [Paenibacillus cellulosilyticus]